MTLPVACIVGPTASGKSGLSELVALALGCPVVSVDSMQVYRGMDIATAKTPPAERRVPLWMVDVADPWEDYSAQRFQADARACVDRSLAEFGAAVLCGGTGLYLDAVIDEMDFPSGDKGGERRASYERMAEEQGADALWELLSERDPESAAGIHRNNVRRVVRALEMLDEGVSYAEQRSGLGRHVPHYDALIFALEMDRERLYARIDERVDLMFEQGLEQEMRGLAEAAEAATGRPLDRSRTSWQAIGAKELLAAFAGECTVEEARELMKRRSRRYAKRQLSWLRRDGRARVLDMDALTAEEACEIVVSAVRDAEGGSCHGA